MSDLSQPMKARFTPKRLTLILLTQTLLMSGAWSLPTIDRSNKPILLVLAIAFAVLTIIMVVKSIASRAPRKDPLGTSS